MKQNLSINESKCRICFSKNISQILDLGNLTDKWLSFGWDTHQIDGHNFQEIIDYFNNKKLNKKPKMLIANTIKGKGFTFSENNNIWHHSIITKKIYENALEEIRKEA